MWMCGSRTVTALWYREFCLETASKFQGVADCRRRGAGYGCGCHLIIEYNGQVRLASR